MGLDSILKMFFLGEHFLNICIIGFKKMFLLIMRQISTGIFPQKRLISSIIMKVIPIFVDVFLNLEF